MHVFVTNYQTYDANTNFTITTNMNINYRFLYTQIIVYKITNKFRCQNNGLFSFPEHHSMFSSEIELKVKG